MPLEVYSRSGDKTVSAGGLRYLWAVIASELLVEQSFLLTAQQGMGLPRSSGS